MIYLLKLLGGSLLGLASGRCMPFLLMVALNKTKGAGVNIEGRMFQFPAWLLIAGIISGCILVMHLLIKKTNRWQRVLLVFVYVVLFAIPIIIDSHLFI